MKKIIFLIVLLLIPNIILANEGVIIDSNICYETIYNILLFCFIHNSHSTTLHVLMWKKRKNDGMVWGKMGKRYLL